MIASQLPIAPAYRDQGRLLEEPTRWTPRVVWCWAVRNGSNASGVPYVVKFRQGPIGTAALISEVVSHALLEALRFPSLEAALVHVSPNLASGYAGLVDVGYTVLPGLHFGTVKRDDIYPGPAEAWEQLKEPADLIRIWVLDCWLMNLDRDTYGNYALTDPDAKGRFRLLPVDHSDCFLGAGSLCDGSYVRRSPTYGAARYGRFVERALSELAPRLLPELAARIQKATAAIPLALARVPEAWWSESNVNPSDLQRCLNERTSRVRDIILAEQWEKVSHATAGGRLLNI